MVRVCKNGDIERRRSKNSEWIKCKADMKRIEIKGRGVTTDKLRQFCLDHNRVTSNPNSMCSLNWKFYEDNKINIWSSCNEWNEILSDCGGYLGADYDSD